MSDVRGVGDAAQSRWYQASYDDQHRQLEKHRAAAGIDETCLKPIIQHLLPRYAEEDARALSYQAAFARAAVGVYVLSAAAVTIAIVQLLWFPDFVELIWAEVGAMMLALGTIVISRRRKWHHRWLHARHMAEQLRTAMYVLVVPGWQSGYARHMQTLPHYDAPDEAIYKRVQATLEDQRLTICQTNDLDVVRRFIADGWILDQAAFHERTAERKHARAWWMHCLVNTLFVVTLIAAALHAMGFGHGSHDEHGDHAGHGAQAAGAVHPPESEREHGAMPLVVLITIVCTIALPAWASAVHGMTDLFEWERIGKRSHRMAALLRQKAELARNAASIDELRQVVSQTESIMAIENYEWLVSIGFRHPPPVPT